MKKIISRILVVVMLVGCLAGFGCCSGELVNNYDCNSSIIIIDVETEKAKIKEEFIKGLKASAEECYKIDSWLFYRSSRSIDNNVVYTYDAQHIISNTIDNMLITYNDDNIMIPNQIKYSGGHFFFYFDNDRFLSCSACNTFYEWKYYESEIGSLSDLNLTTFATTYQHTRILQIDFFYTYEEYINISYEEFISEKIYDTTEASGNYNSAITYALNVDSSYYYEIDDCYFAFNTEQLFSLIK